jgi:arsenate reductase
MTEIYPHPEISLDQALALKLAAARLADDFEGTFGAPTTERFLHTSYDQFAERATILGFLPLLAE